MPLPEHELTKMWKSRVSLENRDATINERAISSILEHPEISPSQKERFVESIGDVVSRPNNHGNKEEAIKIALETAKRELEKSWSDPAQAKVRGSTLYALQNNVARYHPSKGLPITRFLEGKQIESLPVRERELALLAIARETSNAEKPEVGVEHLVKHGHLIPLNWMKHNEESSLKALNFLAEALEKPEEHNAGNVAGAVTEMANRELRDATENRELEEHHPLKALHTALKAQGGDRKQLVMNQPEATSKLLKEIVSADREERAKKDWGLRFTQLLRGK